MPVRFTAPTRRTSSLGDGYTLYKRSLIPVVPIVDDIVLEEGEVDESIPDDDKDDKTENGKRKASTEEEIGTTSETSKKPKKETDSGESIENDADTATGSKTPAVSSKSNGDEPPVGDTSVSVPVESEPSDPEQKTEEKDRGSTV